MEEVKLVVFGGRDFNDMRLLEAHVLDLANGVYEANAVSIVSGMAKGADWLAYEFANKYNVMCYEFPADWDKYGKRAGFIRNEEMAKFSDVGLAFWDGQSKGTKHMIDYMTSLGKPVQVVNY